MRKPILKVGFAVLLGITILLAQNTLLSKVWAGSTSGGFNYALNRTPLIATSGGHTLAIKGDGSVLGVGQSSSGQVNVNGWTNITSIDTGVWHTVGISGGGSVIATGNNNYGQVSGINGMGAVAVTAGNWHSVLLRSDGTVHGAGQNDYDQLTGIGTWTNVKAIAAGVYFTVGLRGDGTFHYTGDGRGNPTSLGWTNIVTIAAGDYATLGLKSDGTVVTTDTGYGNPAGWTNIVQIDAGAFHIVGLRADGTVVANGYDGYGQVSGVSTWTNIIAVAAGGHVTIGLKADGTIVAAGYNSDGQCNVSTWSGLKNYNKKPVVSTTSPTANQKISAVSGYNTFTLSGKVYDGDGENVTISATINGVLKTTTISPAPTTLPASNNWSLTWYGSELNEGTYSNFTITATDNSVVPGSGTTTFIYSLTVDKTGPSQPVLNLSTTNWTNNDVTFTLTPGTDAVAGVWKSQYRLNAGTWTDYSSMVTISTSGSHTVEIKTIDLVGNSSSIASGTARIDKNAPTAPTITLSTTEWTTGNVTVSITGGTDALSGVLRTEYKMSTDGVWSTYINGFTVYDVGITSIYARTLDNAGNATEALALVKIKSDTTGPLVTLLIANGATYITSTATTLQITAIDNLTSNSSLTMRFSNDNSSWSSWEPYTALKSWTVTSGDALKTVYVQVKDTDSNITSASDTVYLSSATPSNSSSSSSSGTLIGGYYYLKDNEVTINMTNSGASTIRYSVSEGVWSEWENVAASKTLQLPSGDGKKKIQFQLKNSNEKPSSAYTINFVLDTAAPNFNLATLNGATATSNGSITLEISALFDNLSTSGFKYSVNGGAQNALPVNNQIAVTGLTIGLQTINIRIYDQAGNYSEKSVKVWRL